MGNHFCNFPELQCPHTQLRSLRGDDCEVCCRLPVAPKISMAQEWQGQGFGNRRMSLQNTQPAKDKESPLILELH